MSTAPATRVEHHVEISHVPRSASGGLVLPGGHRARCSCGWWSDCYHLLSDTRRAIEVHLQRARREDFQALIDASSIGAGVADIKKRGLDAHLADLERVMRPRRARKAKRVRESASAASKPAPASAAPSKPAPEGAAKEQNAAKKLQDAAFLRGFGLALATIWRCQHDGQLVEMLIRENGLALDAFRGVDLLEADFAAIRAALASRR